MAERLPRLWGEFIRDSAPAATTARRHTAAAIGCHTADALRAAGCENMIVAEQFDSDGLTERLIQDWKERDTK